MWMIARHLISIAILPFTVTVVIPYWLYASESGRGRNALLVGLGVPLIVLGLTLFASSLRRFANEGQGTLAPWDPPRNFVVAGPYRFVRNPMISGVVLVLFGEAAVVQTRGQLFWALAFLAGNAVMIPLVEEPLLRRKFGPAYEEYCRNVGRLVPRLRPWDPRAG